MWPKRLGSSFFGLVAIVTTIVALAVSSLPAIPKYAPDRPIVWIGVMIILFVSVAFMSKATTGFYRGLWLDDRYRYSLSRLQIVLWTILILSAYLTASMSNVIIPDPDIAERSESIKRYEESLKAAETSEAAAVQKAAEVKTVEANKAADQAKDTTKKAREAFNAMQEARLRGPLEVAIPAAIWILLGISMASLVGSPMILNAKRSTVEEGSGGRETAKLDQAKQTLKDQFSYTESKVEQLGNDGKVLINKDPTQATLGELFLSDYVGNAATLDVGKVQLFLFTFIVLFVYGSGLFVLFASGRPIHQFPDLDTSTVALLGLSNAGYLAYKAAPVGGSAKTGSASEQPPA